VEIGRILVRHPSQTHLSYQLCRRHKQEDHDLGLSGKKCETYSKKYLTQKELGCGSRGRVLLEALSSKLGYQKKKTQKVISPRIC
jgi:hypothetical protein